ncbi:MAG: hypothetical protein LBD48_08995 [Treponema sp.]|nr:hypothetical protein [Treponema sp.]
MNTDQDNALGEFALLRLIPPVLRARAFRLYTQGGQRLVDLWQNGGAAALGHTPPFLLRELKNTASRGLFAPLPHFLEQRFFRALSRLIPGRTFRLYAAAPAALETLVENGNAALWRPFINAMEPLEIAPNAPPVLIPVIPGIQGWNRTLPLGLCVLALDPAFEAVLPPDDLLSPVLLAAATRGIYEIIAAAPERVKDAYPRIGKALCQSSWQRRGIYLFPARNTDPGTWPALFCRFLDSGFLLPPGPAYPAILPGELSPGEETKLAALVKDSGQF